MIVNICHHFALETTIRLFEDHGDGENEMLVEDDHRTQLVKFVADKYFTLRLFNSGKQYTEEITYEGQQGDRHRLNNKIYLKRSLLKCEINNYAKIFENNYVKIFVKMSKYTYLLIINSQCSICSIQYMNVSATFLKNILCLATDHSFVPASPYEKTT